RPETAAGGAAAPKGGGGRCRRRKSIGSSASRRRNSVTRSNTGRGHGPNEPVLRLATVGSSIIRERAEAQKASDMKGSLSRARNRNSGTIGTVLLGCDSSLGAPRFPATTPANKSSYSHEGQVAGRLPRNWRLDKPNCWGDTDLGRLFPQARRAGKGFQRYSYVHRHA